MEALQVEIVLFKITSHCELRARGAHAGIGAWCSPRGFRGFWQMCPAAHLPLPASDPGGSARPGLRESLGV